MATPESLLIGIACILAQGNSAEVAKVKESLSVEQAQLIEELGQNGLCEKLEQYLHENDGLPGKDVLISCQSCWKTTTMKPNERK